MGVGGGGARGAVPRPPGSGDGDAREVDASAPLSLRAESSALSISTAGGDEDLAAEDEATGTLASPSPAPTEGVASAVSSASTAAPGYGPIGSGVDAQWAECPEGTLYPLVAAELCWDLAERSVKLGPGYRRPGPGRSASEPLRGAEAVALLQLLHRVATLGVPGLEADASTALLQQVVESLLGGLGPLEDGPLPEVGKPSPGGQFLLLRLMLLTLLVRAWKAAAAEGGGEGQRDGKSRDKDKDKDKAEEGSGMEADLAGSVPSREVWSPSMQRLLAAPLQPFLNRVLSALQPYFSPAGDDASLASPGPDTPLGCGSLLPARDPNMPAGTYWPFFSDAAVIASGGDPFQVRTCKG